MSEQPRIAPPSKDFLDARRRENAPPPPPPPPGADESGWQWIREYEVWPGRNVFCCFGHLMTGPVEDIGPNSCAWFLLLTPMVLFFFTWGVTLWYASLPLFVFVCACFASAIFWLVVTGFMDPGIIPRNDDPEIDSQPPPPLYRERVDDDGNTVSDTWCHTCKIYRPPRASHCSDCDNCVLEFDHHCPFTRNCIGKRNYPAFVCFLVSVCASLGMLFVYCIALANSPLPGERSREQLPVIRLGSSLNTVLVLFAAFVSLVLWGFTGYHVWLICTGFTTKENLRGRKHGATSMGVCDRLLCCYSEPSKIAPRRLVLRPVEGSMPPQHSWSVPIVSTAFLDLK